MTTSAAPVELILLPPRRYAVFLALATLAALVALVVSGLPALGKLLLVPAALVTAASAWRVQSRWTHAVIHLHRDGAADWLQKDSQQRLDGRLVDHWNAGPLVALVLSPEQGARLRIAVWRDQVDGDAWRRLLILLRHDRRGGGALG